MFGGLLMLGLHTVAFYMGASMAELEYVDIWRALVAALISYIVMFVISLLLLPLAFVPLVNQLIGAAVLFLGSAVAAKMVFSCDWKPAWIIGAVAAGVNFLAAFVFRGCQ
jgi:hypothetical protein